MTEEINLDKFNKSIEARQMTKDDIDEIIALQNICFPGMEPWKKEHLESHINLVKLSEVVQV